MLVLCVVLALLALWLFLEPLEEPPESTDPGEPDDVEEPDADPPEDTLDGPSFRALNAALPETWDDESLGGGTDGDQ